MHAVGARLAIVGVALAAASAHADPSSGVDGALFRPSFDANGIFSVEGARLMPKREMSFKLLVGYGKSPLEAAVPGIGSGPGDTAKDQILNFLATMDMVFGMSLTDRLAMGFDIAGYRTGTGAGYGIRGRYGSGGVISKNSTGLISLRALSNFDPSANPNDMTAYLGDGLAGPLDTRFALKYGLYSDPHIALTLIGTITLPFGDEDMLLGDRSATYEPRLAFEWRPDKFHQTRVVANAAARFRQRSVLEAYDTANPMMSSDDAKVFLDIGSEAIVSAGAAYEITPRTIAAVEVEGFVPLPDTLSYGRCDRYNGDSCDRITKADYWPGAKHGDLTGLATLGLMLRLTDDVTADLMLGAGAGGARADDFRITTGIVWAPQLAATNLGTGFHHDRDGDGVLDAADACPDEPEDKDGYQDEDGCPDLDNDGDGVRDADDHCPNEPEDKDGFQDEDGCPELDNDNDGIPDSVDKCPNDPEDKDGFEDDDGCPDQDNDGDGIPDSVDKCPNDPETKNGFEDDDGCPDVVANNGPEEKADRIDLKGAQITFDKQNKLTPAGKEILKQIAAIMKKNPNLKIRAEVHVPLGTKATSAAAIAAQQKQDAAIAQSRGLALLDFFKAEGLDRQFQPSAIGSRLPLEGTVPTDRINDHVDFIKQEQGATP